MPLVVGEGIKVKFNWQAGCYEEVCDEIYWGTFTGIKFLWEQRAPLDILGPSYDSDTSHNDVVA